MPINTRWRRKCTTKVVHLVPGQGQLHLLSSSPRCKWPLRMTKAVPCKQSCSSGRNQERSHWQHPCMSSSHSLEDLMAAVGCSLCWHLWRTVAVGSAVSSSSVLHISSCWTGIEGWCTCYGWHWPPVRLYLRRHLLCTYETNVFR